MNRTNLNSCWERRANAVAEGLRPADGRRFNFAPVPAAELEWAGPAQALRPAEVAKLVACGAIRFPTPRVTSEAEVEAETRVPHRRKAVGEVLPPEHTAYHAARNMATERGRRFSVKDLESLGFGRVDAFAALSKLKRLGLVEVVRVGTRGHGGVVSIYRGITEGKR